MASTITAGNATNGLALSCDNTGILELKTGTGSGTTAMTIGTGQQVAVTLGSAAAPAITFAGDTNTGIFSPAADTLAFAEGGAEALRINSSGTVILAGGSTSADGTGITFPATQSASTNANTLDDYEEGSWTPVAAGTSSAGTGTYTTQQGRYTKIGQVCIFQMTIGWSAHTGTGSLIFTGLPFTALSSGGQSAASIGYNQGLSFTNFPTIYILSAATRMDLTQTTTGGAVSGIPMDTAVTELVINGHYIVA